MKRSSIAILFLVFFVAAAGAQTITVTKPALNETWVKGQAYTIIWTKSGTMPNLVRISLRNAATLAEIALIQDNAPNSGSCQWTIPAATAEGSYKIRVKVKNVAIEDDSDAFKIATSSGPAVRQPLASAAKDLGLVFKFPALVIYQAGMVPYDDMFKVTFGYKNSGTGDLPKSSEMPVKPNFRVIIDGKEVNRGSLIFPAFSAPPGWEVPTFYACEIKRQTGGPFDPTVNAFDPTVNVGNQLTVNINENKVNGMASDSQSYNLRTMALNYSYDIMISEVTLDWNTGLLTATIRLDGVFEPNDEMELWDENILHFPGYPYWHVLAKAVPGQHLYTLSRKRDGLKGQNEHKVALRVCLRRSSDPILIYKDIDHRNNSYDRVFHR